MGWFWLVVAIILIYLAVTYWYYALALAAVAAAIGGFIWMMKRREEERKRYALLADERERQRATYERQYQEENEELLRLNQSALDWFDDIPRHLMSAEELIDAAENDFHEGAFAPFWDSIEQAIKKIGSVDYNVKAIEYASRRYVELMAKGKRHRIPRFPISREAAERLRAANETEGRLKALVRKAQRNFHFATIYEQRKTNEILVAGFTNLAEALRGMGAQISGAIDTLSASIADMSDSMIASNEALGERLTVAISDANTALGNRISDHLSDVRGSVADAGRVAAKSGDGVRSAVRDVDGHLETHFASDSRRHLEALAMLDNIQRRRFPDDHTSGDRAY